MDPAMFALIPIRKTPQLPPTGWRVYVILPPKHGANRVVEECMLLINTFKAHILFYFSVIESFVLVDFRHSLS